jgi:hypothetical protein
VIHHLQAAFKILGMVLWDVWQDVLISFTGNHAVLDALKAS